MSAIWASQLLSVSRCSPSSLCLLCCSRSSSSSSWGPDGKLGSGPRSPSSPAHLCSAHPPCQPLSHLCTALLTRSCSRLSRWFSSRSRHRASSFPLGLRGEARLGDPQLSPSPYPLPWPPCSPVAVGLLQLHTQGGHLLPQLCLLRPALGRSCAVGLRGGVDSLEDAEKGSGQGPEKPWPTLGHRPGPEDPERGQAKRCATWQG